MKNPATASRLDALVQQTWEHNGFYRQHWCAAGVQRGQKASEHFDELPLITRQQLLADQLGCPPLGKNLSCDLSKLQRFHQSSGTTGDRMYWADTIQSWDWVMHCSRQLFEIAGVTNKDRIFAAVPFAASSGPWIIFEGALTLGAACLTAGNASLADQAALIVRYKPNVVIGKADHLLRLGESLAGKVHVPKLVLTGQNTFWAIRKDLNLLWGCECFDRYGMTEAGSIASECAAHAGCLHILDDEFIAECYRPGEDTPVADGESGELVLTNLGRTHRPIIRYRTGDFGTLVRNYRCACGRTGDVLIGGVNRIRS